MKISELKNNLEKTEEINFILPDGKQIPQHFHVTEIGAITKKFIDCGGDIHSEIFASIQIWTAEDYEHRLKPKSLLNIIELSKKVLGEVDLEIEVEYQINTINKFALSFDGKNFLLEPKYTDCLAKIKCNIPVLKTSCCNDSNCC